MGIDRINQHHNDPAVTGPAASRRSERASENQPKQDQGVRPASDSVEISDAARELAKARQAVDAAPDVRSDKVAAIRKRIEDGTYSVSPELLARKLLESSDGQS
jgi:negative regulator of flagellin synthesis FlgM